MPRPSRHYETTAHHEHHEPSHDPGKKPSDPKQKSAHLDALYREAEVAQKELDGVTRRVAGEVGAEPLIPPSLKGRERAQAKIDAEYGGHADRIVDLARSSIICDTPSQVERAYQILQKDYKVVRVKDRFATPKSGYRDMLLNLEMKNGHVVEVQIHLRKILEVKNSAVGHGIYEEIQKIERAASVENRPFTRAEAETLEKLNRKMKREYDAAYHASKSHERAARKVAHIDQPLEQPVAHMAQHGHGHGDHGHHTTASQQGDRIRTGVTPSGRHGPTSKASHFGSVEAEAEAFGRGRRQLEADLKNGGVLGAFPDPVTGKPTYVDPTTGKPTRHKVVVPTQRPGGFGHRIVKRKDASGVVIRDAHGNIETEVSSVVLNKAVVIWEYFASRKEWRVVTYYPE